MCADGIYGHRVLHGGRHRQRVRIVQHRHQHLDATGFDTRWGSLRFCLGCLQWQGVCSGRHHRHCQHGTGIRRSDQYVVGGDGSAKRLPAGGLPAGGSVPVCGGRVQHKWAQRSRAELGAEQGSAVHTAKSAIGEQHNHLPSGHDFSAWGVDLRAGIHPRKGRLWGFL